MNWGVQRRPPDSELSSEETDQPPVACLLEAGGDLGQILARSEPQFPHHATGSGALGVFPLHVIMWLLSQMSPSPQQGDRILFSLTSPVTLRVLSVFPGGHCEPQDDPSHSGKDTPCCSQGGRGSLRAPPSHCLHRGHTWTCGSHMVWALVLAWPCPVQLGTPVAGWHLGTLCVNKALL